MLRGNLRSKQKTVWVNNLKLTKNCSISSYRFSLNKCTCKAGYFHDNYDKFRCVPKCLPQCINSVSFEICQLLIWLMLMDFCFNFFRSVLRPTNVSAMRAMWKIWQFQAHLSVSKIRTHELKQKITITTKKQHAIFFYDYNSKSISFLTHHYCSCDSYAFHCPADTSLHWELWW